MHKEQKKKKKYAVEHFILTIVEVFIAQFKQATPKVSNRIIVLIETTHPQ